MRCRPAQACVLFLFLVLLAAWGIYADVEKDGRPLYKASAAPFMPVAIVFGAGIRNAVVDDRVQTGVDLYKQRRVRKLLMTGDNGRAEYDEPDAMKAQALAAGVPASDIVCDYAGFRTYDSLYRARDIFGVTQAARADGSSAGKLTLKPRPDFGIIQNEREAIHVCLKPNAGVETGNTLSGRSPPV